jgi:cytochrome c-type biogenesis protein CcsB
MYESIAWVALGAFSFSLILYLIQKQPIVMAVGSAMATLLLIVGDSAPAMMDPGIHPLVPVLRSNYWLTIHVLTITLGYAAFALSFGLGNATLFQYLKRAPEPKRIATMNLLTYRAMQFGTVLLAAGTILGGIWADYSWGRFWGWDPKETWALIALLCYLAILHARFTDKLSQFTFAVWTVLAFSAVVMAWYGVNFVLGVGLHSYGFSNGGQGWVASGLVVQFAYIAFVVGSRNRRLKTRHRAHA